jgi:hypothetical protein
MFFLDMTSTQHDGKFYCSKSKSGFMLNLNKHPKTTELIKAKAIELL